MKNTAQKLIRKNDFAGLHIAGLITVMMCLLFISKPSFAADDDYLRSLEAEANNGSNTTNTSGIGNNYLDALSKEADSSSKVSTKAQHDDAYYREMKKMEALLEDKKPSTYKYYEKLSPKDRARIFDAYAADKSDQEDRLTHLRKKTMDIYFKQ